MPTFKIVHFCLKEWFLEKCLDFVDRNTMTFESIDEYLAKFQNSDITDCKYAYFILNKRLGLQNMSRYFIEWFLVKRYYQVIPILRKAGTLN